MRILTVRQPWAWAIIHGGKDVENRVRNIAGGYRGPVAIHVALADAENAPESLWLQHSDWYRGRTSQPKKFDPAWSDRGHIIGVVDLVDVHPSGDCWGFDEDGERWCSPWSEPLAHHLALRNPRALGAPIAYTGTLGLRRLDDDMIARINRELS